MQNATWLHPDETSKPAPLARLDEVLANLSPSDRAEVWRGVALELADRYEGCHER